MIVFEGTDGVGKTTLAQACAKLMLHRGTLTNYKAYSVLPAWWDYFHHYLHDIRPGTILDRFTASEAVYGPLFRQKINDNFTPLNRAVVARELQRVGTITVFVDAPDEIIKERISARGDKLFTIPQIIAAGQSFRDLMGTATAIPQPNKWDFTHTFKVRAPDPVLESDKFTALVRWIVEASEGMEKRQELFNTHTKIDASGTLYQPEVIIVGETQNDELGGPNRAFCAGRSSHYLHRLLLAAGLNPFRCLFVNALQRDGSDLPHHVMRLIREDTKGYPIVAMGKDAEKYCKRVDLVVNTFHHPSYLTRFRSGDFDKVAEEFSEVVKNGNWQK